MLACPCSTDYDAGFLSEIRQVLVDLACCFSRDGPCLNLSSWAPLARGEVVWCVMVVTEDLPVVFMRLVCFVSILQGWDTGLKVTRFV